MPTGKKESGIHNHDYFVNFVSFCIHNNFVIYVDFACKLGMCCKISTTIYLYKQILLIVEALVKSRSIIHMEFNLPHLFSQRRPDLSDSQVPSTL